MESGAAEVLQPVLLTVGDEAIGILTTMTPVWVVCNTDFKGDLVYAASVNHSCYNLFSVLA